MLITLHCGGMPFDGTTVKEKSLGGSESAAYYMARELARQGHRVTLFTNTQEESETDGVRYIPAGNVTAETPLGDMFHFYAENTPCDVMIIQRHPRAFAYKWASKVNLWWLHDLALYRNRVTVQDMMWNVDGVLTVSEWHAAQVVDVYGLNPDIVYPITNGVDLSLFEGAVDQSIFAMRGDAAHKETRLLYSSRPERGLENLVGPAGIMEELRGTDRHLYVCAYDNVTEPMRDYYDYLTARCEELPNVTLLGSLTKKQLADVMRQCDLHVYPTGFEETSCITAMECMAAGLPMVASEVGAVPETTEGAGVEIIPLKDDRPDIDGFVQYIKAFDYQFQSKESQRKKAQEYSWENACEKLTNVISICFAKARTSEAACLRHLVDMSDFYAAQEHALLHQKADLKDAGIYDSIITELEQCYAFTKEKVWDEHYANYYKYEESKGVEYGPEDVTNSHRFLHVASVISGLPSGSTIMDYGCAHGHYTITLAKQFPELHFTGIDITQSNVDKARQWAKDEGLDNVSFECARVEDGFIQAAGEPLSLDLFDCIIAAEVLEHVADPAGHVDTLQQYLAHGGTMLITTPYGPWEAQGYKKEWPWRAHVHHFEREDLQDVWGHNDDFNVVNVPAGKAKDGSALGSYVTTWKNTRLDSRRVDLDRKFSLLAPRQTVSCCMIAKESLATIQRCLDSVMPYVDELVIGFDRDNTHGTMQMVTEYMQAMWPEKSRDLFVSESPLQVGFAAARNKTVARATGDWILWIDSDEYLHGGERIASWLRNNQYNGYAINQHHLSMEPLGITKTDLPVRLFRNNKDIEFYGLVHEHPEQGLNKGVGHVTTLEGVSILHDGYTDEATRRARFRRNIGLLAEDRKVNPERTLGKFLWLRDLAQTAEWELESNGAHVTATMLERAEEGIVLWRELLQNGDLRIAVDALPYYSSLCRIIGGGFEMDLRLDTSAFGEAKANEVRPVKAYFNCAEDAEYLMQSIFRRRTETYGSKYR